MKKPRDAGLFLICRLVEPGAAGVRVEPLGEGLIWVLPDGFSPLFRAAAALPALFVMPVSGRTRRIACCRSAGGRSRRRAARCRATRGRTSACRAATGLRERKSAREDKRRRQSQCCEFHDCSFACCVRANEVRQPCVPACRSQFVAVPRGFHWRQMWKQCFEGGSPPLLGVQRARPKCSARGDARRQVRKVRKEEVAVAAQASSPHTMRGRSRTTVSGMAAG